MSLRPSHKIEWSVLLYFILSVYLILYFLMYEEQIAYERFEIKTLVLPLLSSLVLTSRAPQEYGYGYISYKIGY